MTKINISDIKKAGHKVEKVKARYMNSTCYYVNDKLLTMSQIREAFKLGVL